MNKWIKVYSHNACLSQVREKHKYYQRSRARRWSETFQLKSFMKRTRIDISWNRSKNRDESSEKCESKSMKNTIGTSKTNRFRNIRLGRHDGASLITCKQFFNQQRKYTRDSTRTFQHLNAFRYLLCHYSPYSRQKQTKLRGSERAEYDGFVEIMIYNLHNLKRFFISFCICAHNILMRAGGRGREENMLHPKYNTKFCSVRIFETC